MTKLEKLEAKVKDLKLKIGRTRNEQDLEDLGEELEVAIEAVGGERALLAAAADRKADAEEAAAEIDLEGIPEPIAAELEAVEDPEERVVLVAAIKEHLAAEDEVLRQAHLRNLMEARPVRPY